MGAVALWGWCDDPAGWVKVLVDDTGRLIIDPSAILEDDPTDGETEKAPTSNWAHDHEVATTGVHGVGTGTIGSVSTANKTIYVDKAATGEADGTSWTDAFTTIQAAVDSLEDIILHAYTITVRKGATPYRETVYLNSNPAVNPSHSILGSLTIEAEYYWYGDCEANVGGAGEITDTGAFADVAVGDKVYILDLNGANGRAQDYELCTVDDISNAPDRIGTDGAKTPTTNWKYVIVRTEISGSDDGTDGGTARGNCVSHAVISNVYLDGFYMTFSDSYVIMWNACTRCYWRYSICKDCDRGVLSEGNSTINATYIGIFDTEIYGVRQSHGGKMTITYFATNANYALEFAYGAVGECTYWCLASGANGARCQHNGIIYMNYGTILNSVTNGLIVLHNSCIYTYRVTNSATTPETPAGTVEGACIITA